jgi:hypothetical protein
MDMHRGSTAAPDAADAADVIAYLDRLLCAPSLKISDRNRRFLAFVVKEALEGRGDRIKAYTIGVDVFGRGEAFDAASDPIVRIEAARLRSALTSYYEGAGIDDPVRITLPPGGYAPAFACGDRRLAGDAAPSSKDPPLELHSGRDRAFSILLHVAPGDAQQGAQARAELLLDAVATHLCLGDTAVYLRESSLQPSHDVTLSARRLTSGWRLSWTIVESATGRLLKCGCSECTDSRYPDQADIDAAAHALVADLTKIK